MWPKHTDIFHILHTRLFIRCWWWRTSQMTFSTFGDSDSTLDSHNFITEINIQGTFQKYRCNRSGAMLCMHFSGKSSWIIVDFDKQWTIVWTNWAMVMMMMMMMMTMTVKISQEMCFTRKFAGKFITDDYDTFKQCDLTCWDNWRWLKYIARRWSTGRVVETRRTVEKKNFDVEVMVCSRSISIQTARWTLIESETGIW